MNMFISVQKLFELIKELVLRWEIWSSGNLFIFFGFFFFGMGDFDYNKVFSLLLKIKLIELPVIPDG